MLRIKELYFRHQSGDLIRLTDIWTAVTPYVDACEIQFGNKSYNIIVADGNLLNRVLQLIKQRRQIP